MSTYPYGTADTGVFNIFQTNFSPDDVVRGIRDNYTPINRTSLMNSLGYQVGLLQNFVNSTYIGRSTTPISSGYITNLMGSNINLSGTLLASGTTNLGAMFGNKYESCFLDRSGVIAWRLNDTGGHFKAWYSDSFLRLETYNNTDGTDLASYGYLDYDNLTIWASGTEIEATYVRPQGIYSYTNTDLTVESSKRLYLNSDDSFSVYLSGVWIFSDSDNGILPKFGSSQYLGSSQYKWNFVYGNRFMCTDLNMNSTSINIGVSDPTSMSYNVEHCSYIISNNNASDVVIDLNPTIIASDDIVWFTLKDVGTTSKVTLSGDIALSRTVELIPGDSIAFRYIAPSLYPLVSSGVIV